MCETLLALARQSRKQEDEAEAAIPFQRVDQAHRSQKGRPTRGTSCLQPSAGTISSELFLSLRRGAYYPSQV